MDWFSKLAQRFVTAALTTITVLSLFAENGVIELSTVLANIVEAYRASIYPLFSALAPLGIELTNAQKDITFVTFFFLQNVMREVVIYAMWNEDENFKRALSKLISDPLIVRAISFIVLSIVLFGLSLVFAIAPFAEWTHIEVENPLQTFFIAIFGLPLFAAVIGTISELFSGLLKTGSFMASSAWRALLNLMPVYKEGAFWNVAKMREIWSGFRKSYVFLFWFSAIFLVLLALDQIRL